MMPPVQIHLLRTLLNGMPAFIRWRRWLLGLLLLGVPWMGYLTTCLVVGT